MDSIQKLLVRIGTQLRGLSLSQRLAIGLGGLLAAVSVIWMIHWAASPEMIPLLDQDFEPDELAQVRTELESMDEPFKLVGQKVMVRSASHRQVILAHLQQRGKMPADTSAGFSALVKEANPWISQAEHERRWSVALKHEIERVLRQFDGVRSASVFLPLTAKSRGFARVQPPTSASATLIMNGGVPVSRDLALAVARLVSGAVRGLPMQNVEVLDGNGVVALDWDSESAGTAALDRKRRQEERDIKRKISNQLADPKSKVDVQVTLNLTDESIQTESPTRPQEVKVESTSEETTRARPSGQPGVQPNVGVAAGGRLADEHTIKETSKAESVPGMTRELKATPPGGILEISAAINISRSFLESVYRQSNPDADRPTDELIEQVFEEQRARIVSLVSKLVQPQEEQQVAVSWYPDSAADYLAPAAEGSALDETFQFVQRYGPQSGLGLLALLSLGLMLRMARKTDASEAFGLEIGLPKEAVEAAQQAAVDASDAAQQRGKGRRKGGRPGAGPDEGVLEVGPVAVGQAAVTEGVLVAQEVDAKTVQTHKMLQQVSTAVQADPEGSSALLEQWVQRTDSYDT